MLNLLSLIFAKGAIPRQLVEKNPVSLVTRPKERRRKWRILSPVETQRVERVFAEVIAEADTDRDRDDLIVVRRIFLFHMVTALRLGERSGLRWRAVFLADPGGPFLRVEENWVRSRTDSPKSDAGLRTISLGEKMAAELWEHRRWSRFRSDDDYVFPNPRTGHPFDPNRYSELLYPVLKRAGIEGVTRPTYELRHSSITNSAAAGTPPEALMTRSGHTSYSTTKRYIDLAGERFREEAGRLEDRLFGASGTKLRYQDADSLPEEDPAKVANPHE